VEINPFISEIAGTLRLNMILRFPIVASLAVHLSNRPHHRNLRESPICSKPSAHWECELYSFSAMAYAISSMDGEARETYFVKDIGKDLVKDV
jgi:hypothetical protein